MVFASYLADWLISHGLEEAMRIKTHKKIHVISFQVFLFFVFEMWYKYYM